MSKSISKSYNPKTECACGKALHYANLSAQDAATGAIAGAGGDPFVVVTIEGRSWRVQRHYIALHGLKAKDLPSLGFQELNGDVRGISVEEAQG